VVTGTNATSIAPQAGRATRGAAPPTKEIAVEVERLVEAHPLQPVLISMPGVGIRTAARLLTEVSGKDFATAGHLAAYAGLAPVTCRSGSSIRVKIPPDVQVGELASRGDR
jgi:transposase